MKANGIIYNIKPNDTLYEGLLFLILTADAKQASHY